MDTNRERGAGVPPAANPAEDAGKMPAPHFSAFSPWEDVEMTRRRLPHWRQNESTYFVTFRLGDSIPQDKLSLWKAEKEQWLAAHPKPWDESTLADFTRLFPVRHQQWLDHGYGNCVLGRPEIAETVRSALKHFDGDRYRLDAFVIMPNHVHVLIQPLNGHDLSSILHSWKSFSAKQINKAIGASGPVWQDESFDHIVRSEAQLNFYRSYIEKNPVKAALKGIHGECGAGVPPATNPAEDAGKMPAPHSSGRGAGVRTSLRLSR